MPRVCSSSDLAPGGMVAAKVGPVPVVVVRTKSGSLHALVDRCLHQGGPLSKGVLTWASDTSRDVGEYHIDRDGQILKCPWHGYEYDVTDGCFTMDTKRRLQRFTTWESDGDVFVELRPPQ